VACPKQIGNIPLASGSNAPVCPAFLAKNKRLTFSAKITRNSYLFAILIAILTPVGLLFQGSLTDYFRDPITKVEHSLNLDKAPTPPIGKK
jgi:hypothetical protein